MGKQIWFQRIHPGWWILLFILVLGIWLQLGGYNTGFVVENVDERRFYMDMLYRLEGGTALEKQTLISYPPLLFWLYEAAHHLTADPSDSLLQPHTPKTVALLKLWAVGTNMLTAVWLVLAGRLLGGWKVGLIASLIWIVLPGVITRTVVGLTEAWQACAVMGATYFMLRALAYQDRWAAVVSTAFALVAFLFKFSIFPVFGLGFMATLWHARQSPRHWVGVLGIQVLIVSLGAGIVVAGLRTKDSLFTQEGNEISLFMTGGFLTYLFDWFRTTLVWSSAAVQLRLRPYSFSLLIVVCLASVAVITNRTAWKRLGLVLIVGLASLHLFMINTYLIHEEIVQRYSVPVSALWILIIVTTVQWLVQRFKPILSVPFRNLLLTLFVMLWFAVAFTRSLHFRSQSIQPNSVQEFQEWVGNTLPHDGALLLNRGDWWLFDQYRWDHPVSRIIYGGPITKMTRPGWLDKGILYATLKQIDLETIQNQAPEDLEGMTRLKHISPSGIGDEHFYIYYLPTLQSPVQGPVTFDNGLTLHGCRVKDESEAAQHRVRVQCLWQVPTVPSQHWKLYIHVVSLDSRVPLAQADGALMLPSRPVETWIDANEILIGPSYVIDMPQGVEMSTLRLLVGLYDEATGIRATQNGLDYVELRLPLASQEE